MTQHTDNNPDRDRQTALALYRSGRFQEAQALYRTLCARDARDVQSWHMLAAISATLGQYPEAEQHYRMALSLNPDDPQIHSNLGSLYARLGRYDEAIASYRRAIEILPAFADAHNNLGITLFDLGRFDEAATCLRTAIRLNPARPEAHMNLGSVLLAALDHDGAEASYREALRLDSRNPRYHCGLGRALQARGRYDEALRCYDQALALRPDDAQAISSKADLLEKRGDFENAWRLLHPLVTSGRADGRALLRYATLARRKDEQREAITVIERALTAPLRQHDRTGLHFVLGDLYDDIGEYDSAFTNYSRGNALDGPAADPLHLTRLVESRITAFSAERMRKYPRASVHSDRPVFIVGMPRSGTSLIEQILASHPDVYGAGEIDSVSEIVAGLSKRLGGHHPYPECIEGISQELLDTLAREHGEKLSRLAASARRITDKTPLHFMELGFIELMLPGARIIHCRREPLDTCLSIYFHRFNQYHAYSRDLAVLGGFYRLYRRLMEYWRTVLNIPILEIDYEQLVSDPEPAIHELLGFCGLDWQDQCLRFHETRRDVYTPSYDQVRRPLYRHAISRWKHYERFLVPLRKALDEP
jgi:tetratricopeptide (TPR) repeat protein